MYFVMIMILPLELIFSCNVLWFTCLLLFWIVLSILIFHDSDHDDLQTLNTDRYLFSFSLLGLWMCCTCNCHYDMVSLFLFQPRKRIFQTRIEFEFTKQLTQWHLHLQLSSRSNLQSRVLRNLSRMFRSHIMSGEFHISNTVEIPVLFFPQSVTMSHGHSKMEMNERWKTFWHGAASSKWKTGLMVVSIEMV